MAVRSIKKRHVLVLLIAAVQAICLIVAMTMFNSSLQKSIQDKMHNQVLSDNILLAGQLSNLMGKMDVADLRENKDSWEKLQQTVRQIDLPNDGFVCVIDANDGALLCHPDLHQPPGSETTEMVKPEMVKPGMNKPAMVKPGMNKPAMVKPGMNKPAMVKAQMHKPAMAKPAMAKPAMVKPAMVKPAMVKPAMAKPAMAKPAMVKPAMVKPAMVKPAMAKKPPMQKDPSQATQEVHGMIGDYCGEIQIIAAGFIPELNAQVKVHQKAAAIEKTIAGVLESFVPLSLAFSLGLIGCTTGLIFCLMRHYDNRVARINETLEDTVIQRTDALRKTRDAVVFGLAKLAESRDNDTGQHLDRIQLYVTILAGQLSRSNPEIDKTFINNLVLASSLHDIGKVGVPDQILLKPGGFTPEERRIMETHAEIGGRCLAAISNHLGKEDFLQIAREIAYSHHEKWDGSGYPNGLIGQRIPLSGRIVALADVYDALRSRRPYKQPMPHEKAMAIILEGKGKHFDPEVVDAFVNSQELFLEVSERYANSPEAGENLKASAGQQKALPNKEPAVLQASTV